MATSSNYAYQITLPFVHGNDPVNSQVGLSVNQTNINLDGRKVNLSTYTGLVHLLYTKTTDSPLASDEKFAGVTSGGEVVYERTINITTARNITTNSWNVIDEADSWFGSVDKIISGNVKRNDDCASMPCEFNKNNGHLCIDHWRNDYFNTQTRITIRYTKTS